MAQTRQFIGQSSVQQSLLPRRGSVMLVKHCGANRTSTVVNGKVQWKWIQSADFSVGDGEVPNPILIWSEWRLVFDYNCLFLMVLVHNSLYPGIFVYGDQFIELAGESPTAHSVLMVAPLWKVYKAHIFSIVPGLDYANAY